MNNLPEGPDLLRIAREALVNELKPLLDGEARYTVAMIANAMAIAAREAEAGETRVTEALARLTTIYGDPPRELHGAALRAAVREYERRLAADIRAGMFGGDGDRQRAVLEHLRASVNARLAVSNPKYLRHPGAGRDPESALDSGSPRAARGPE
ncbi:MAG TPA: DUF6285 domain-containing protein [Burkholderiales bacterium]|nr:DUF6285 domain-containing protein [Burkholderiales bacterium]